MLSRLVLDVGALPVSAVRRLADRPGGLRVLDSDADRVARFREEHIPAEHVDVTDADALRAWAPVDVVLVAGTSATHNRAILEAARDAFPDAHLVALAGRDADADMRAAISAEADRAVSLGSALLDAVEAPVRDSRLARRRDLRDALDAVDGELGVIAHDNPDPDAIASASALVAIADSVGCDAEAAYFGEISHQENRAMVNLLELSLRRLPADEPAPYDAFALVDHARPGVNDQLPEDADVRVVIDHHPGSEPGGEVDFVDVRTAAGSTSTLLAEYLPMFGVDVDGPLATALLYGIRVDTDEFRREVSVMDFEAAARLLPDVDRDQLARIEDPSIAGETFETIARAIHARDIRDAALVSCVGAIGDRDALSQAADRLLGLEDVTITVVSGYTDDTVYLSARARGTTVDLGAVLRTAYGDLGSAGGHADMAGAQLPLGLFDDVEEDGMSELVATVVTDRFFGALAGHR